MPNRNVQYAIEEQFNRKLIEERIRSDIEQMAGLNDWITEAVDVLNTYASKQYSYDSKNARMEHVRGLDLHYICKELLIRTAIFQEPELLASVAPQVSGILGFKDKVAGVTTIAELFAVLNHLGAFSIYKETIASSIKFQSHLNLSRETDKAVAGGMFLPPMICPPDALKSNTDSGYLTHTESLILNNNHHNDNICLDVLNSKNKTKLSLSVPFLEQVAEEPTHALKDEFQKHQWEVFLWQSQNIYTLLIENGNEFYINNRVDKRGRIYSSGYHVNPQGTSYKKAMIELANKEVVAGVPEHLKLNK